MRIAEVLLNLPINKTFYYKVPDGLEAHQFLRVVLDFSNREMVGFILRVFDEKEQFDFELKPITEIIDDKPIVTKELIELANWMSSMYFCSFGEALFSFLPTEKKQKRFIHQFSGINESFKKLTDEQFYTFKTIEDSIKKSKTDTFLLYGVTGSGKTEIYKYLVKTTLSLGKSAILLVPEISLTPQNLERFYECFGEKVALYHSKMSKKERFFEWMRVFNGEAKIVIGPRSAVFLPVNKLGLIIIDEEHDTSYKSSNSPRYHARDIARYRSLKENAVVVLGSATPMVETFYNALRKKYVLLELKNRYSVKLPSVEIIDLKEVSGKKEGLISSKLMESMLFTLQKNRQVLLFLNRRGFAPVLICEKCGFVFECSHCNVALTFHKSEKKLICHHCGDRQDVPLKCPSCGGIELKEVGSGTERLEETIKNLFVNCRVERMDLDTTRRKNSYFEILRKIKNHEVDIVIGTQMIAKGHDIAGIELVGVIMPDIMLNIPDFRASERTFSVLTQVIGRAGRKDIPGKALIETFSPDHYAITFAAKQDYRGFFLKELKRRKDFNYPPFVKIGRVVIRGEKKEKVEAFCEELRFFLKRGSSDFDSEILGPVSCPLEKLKNKYRYHIIIKSNNLKNIKEIIEKIVNFFNDSDYKNLLYLEVDIEPLSLI
ncbi:MAG: replication restart helicase PriA [Brevinematia bacterium]